MKAKLIKILSLTSMLLLSSLTSCGQVNSSNQGSLNTSESTSEQAVDDLSSSAPQYQLEDHTDNYIDDSYKNYTQILVYSYAREGGNTSDPGNLKGLISKLDYINDGNLNSKTSMHYDGIYLLPIFPSPSYHKYDAKDYYSIDPQYGTLDDFDNLMTECKKRGISVILDLAINHCSNMNPWFNKAYRAIANTYYDKSNADPVTHGPSETMKEANKYVDWFNFTTDITYQDAEKGIDYSSRKWVKIQGSDWYYEDEFAGGGMPDFNLDNEEVRQEMKNIMKFWLDRGVKGFRFDAVEHFYDDNINKNYEFLNQLYSWGNELSPEGNEYYMVCEGPWSHSLSKYYQNTNVESMMNFYYGGNASKILNTVCDAKTYDKKIQSLIEDEEEIEIDEDLNVTYNGFKYASGAKEFADMVTTWDSQYLSKAGHRVIDGNFMVNHDTKRSINQIGGTFKTAEEKRQGLKLAWMLNNTLSGTSFMYYGEEIGMKNGDQSANADPNKRHPMYWSSDTTKNVRKYPDGATPIEQDLPSVEEQMVDGESLLRFIMEINRMKAVFPEIARGTQEFVKVAKDYLVMKKTYNESSIYLVYNLSYDSNKISLGELGLEEAPTEIKYSLTSSKSYSKLTSDTLNVPGYSITIL